MPGVLLIEDEASVRLATVQSLKLAQLPVNAVETMEEALDQLTPEFDGVVVSDVRLPGRSGLELLAEAQRIDRELPVILVTGHGDVAMAVQAMRDGAYDFVEKPFRPDHLVAVVKRALDKRRLVLENRRLQDRVRSGEEVHLLLGEGVAMQRLRQFVATIGPSGADVLINGETGTGKEVLARALHAGSSGPFVAINCAALPETMFESEMFGHEAGAFTGAQKRRIGKFEYARGGTVFLDELESMPLALQAKLLRVLQERCVERLGGNASVPIDCRVVCASKADLAEMSAQGRFRADLYYRIATVNVDLPPLRSHAEDIPLLLAHFVQQACRRYQRPVPDWTAQQMDEWRARAWPGNVRELKAFAERLVLGVAGADAAPADGSALPLPKRLELIEKRLLREALAAADGQVALAAERLGIPKKTLYDKLKRFEIEGR
ncbi:sigma-54-dependent Fis family transcriptional regulator [Aquincola sp. S2]|uniref:Sigma-54-dependent Fis family transcriptional regulator n=1 Tax=Pseudaquabacterium terrae TaxID=2732868 RepID=A0ABX2EUL5_9BURK|nr:sigma-54 dependent transcriptional regulator [Aquabacterium terrae]NRF72114.1 sigma-54-dependent Fis family transcriptional regulator [Aquabacterium terrae]